jgi:Ca-activated chloride channel family protein
VVESEADYVALSFSMPDPGGDSAEGPAIGADSKPAAGDGPSFGIASRSSGDLPPEQLGRLRSLGYVAEISPEPDAPANLAARTDEQPRRVYGVPEPLPPELHSIVMTSPAVAPIVAEEATTEPSLETEIRKREAWARRARVEPGNREELRRLAKAMAEGRSTERYAPIVENDFVSPLEQPLSTFGVDVDTASYSVVRRHLEEGRMPPRDAVRTEELINYFPYDYRPPYGIHPLAIDVEVAGCPWKPEHRLARIGLRAEDGGDERKPSNLVFLIDVSGSMKDADKLPLLKAALALLVRDLDQGDRLAIVVYAEDAWVALPPTDGDDQATILEAIGDLEADGGTNGGSGIDLAYATARDNFLRRGTNRVILATDGDFNVGTTQSGDLVAMIRDSANDGIFLTTLGFGSGNYQDATLETLADRGNGNYAYIDSLAEARKVLLDQVGGTLETVAKDVKVQVEFNPAEVAAYRLIGYENRRLGRQEFRDDSKDGGEMGAGQTVTALYEIVPADRDRERSNPAPPLRYQAPTRPSDEAENGELMTVKVRYKRPRDSESELITRAATDGGRTIDAASGDFKFAGAVVAFGLLLRDSQHKGEATWDMVIELALDGSSRDDGGYRAAFHDLVWKARNAAGNP